MSALFECNCMLEISINWCATVTAIILQRTKSQQYHNIMSGAGLTFSSLYSVSPQLAVPKFLSTTEGLINYAIPGWGCDVSAELMNRGRTGSEGRICGMQWYIGTVFWLIGHGKDNVRTANNRLIGMALIDKGLACEDRGCGYGGWVSGESTAWAGNTRFTSHHELSSSDRCRFALQQTILISSCFWSWYWRFPVTRAKQFTTLPVSGISRRLIEIAISHLVSFLNQVSTNTFLWQFRAILHFAKFVVNSYFCIIH